MNSNTQNQRQKKSFVFIEVLRIIACFMVIVNHTNSQIFQSLSPSSTWFMSLTYYFISKMAVPIFVLISGYTMLYKVDNYKKNTKRIIRIAIVLYLFSIVYYNAFGYGGNLFEMTGVFMEYPITLAFWYLYMYLGLLIMLPFLQKFVSVLSKGDCEIFIGVSLFFNALVPIVEHIFSKTIYSRLIDLAIFDSYVCLLIVGYYIRKFMEPTRKLLLLSIVTFIISLCFNVGLTYRDFCILGQGNYLFYDTTTLLFTILEAISFFCIIMCFSWEGKMSKVWTFVGGCTFGIYLVSDYVIGQTQGIVYPYLCQLGLHPMIAMVLWEILVFITGLVITLIMKQIPGLKKLL